MQNPFEEARAYAPMFEATSAEQLAAAMRTWATMPDAARQHVIARLLYMQVEALRALLHTVGASAEAQAAQTEAFTALANALVQAAEAGEVAPTAPDDDVLCTPMEDDDADG